MGEAAEFQIEDDEAAQAAVKEQQVNAIPGAVDAQAALTANKSEITAQFEQELFKPVNEGGFEAGF